jgi:hypothetical protein
MKAGILYGLMLGIVTPLLTKVAPQPGGSILMWGVIAVQLACAAALTRERMGLFFSSLAMALGSAWAIMVVALYAAGYDMFTFPMPWAAFYWLGAIVIPATLHVDMLLHPTKWEAWKQHMKGLGLWDLLRFRHIPDLRTGATPGPAV